MAALIKYPRHCQHEQTASGVNLVSYENAFNASVGTCQSTDLDDRGHIVFIKISQEHRPEFKNPYDYFLLTLIISKIGEYSVQMDLFVDKSPTNQSLVAPAYSEKLETSNPNLQHSKPTCDKCNICEKLPEVLPLKLDLSKYVRTIVSFERQINHIKPSWV